jgi:hypothetical protein
MEGSTDAAGGKRNKWMSHVRKTMKAHKGKPLSAILKMAKKTYKGGAEGAAERTTLSPLPLSGGASVISPMPVATETGALVGARRKTRKGKKGGKKSRKVSRKH